MISKEDLEELEKLRLASSIRDEVHFILGRPKTTIFSKITLEDGTVLTENQRMGLDPRFDFYTGPEIKDEEIIKRIKESANQNQKPMLAKDILNGRQQLFHFHPEAPALYERAQNVEANANYLLKLLRLAPKLIEELKNMRGLQR